MFVIFSNFDFKDLSDVNFFKNNQQLLNNFKTENIFLLLALFSIFSIIWILLLGFGSPLALFAGFAFGKWLGTLISVVSFSVGATLLYCLASFFFKDFIKNKFYAKLKNFINLFNKNDFMYFTLFRFTGGGMPFAIQNVLPVIFDMKIKKYFFSTLIGIVPSVFIMSSIGAGFGNFIGKNNSIVWIDLIKDPDIYFPILIFVIVFVLTASINKIFFNNKPPKQN